MGATTIKSSKVISSVQVVEQLSKGTLSQRTVTHDIKDDMSFDANTTPDGELIYSANVPLSSGTATLDLKSIANSEGTTIVTEGKKVRVFKARASSSNANALTMTVGASNAYLLAGATWKIALEAGDSCLLILNDNAPAISSSTKDIALSGTGTQSVDIEIIFG